MGKNSKKEMNFETIGEAMQLVYDNKDAKFDEIVDILKQNGFNWTVEEAQKYHAFRMMHGAKTLNLGDGMLAGDLSTGAVFVANCSTSEYGWAFCRDWIPEVPSEGSAVSWLRAHEEQDKQMNAKLEAMGIAKQTTSQVEEAYFGQDRLEKFGDPTLGIEEPTEADTLSDDFGNK